MHPFKHLLPVAAAAAAFSPQVIPALQAAQPEKKTNVVFFVLDDLLPRLNCYGEKGMVTPNIDRLAREGMVFDNAYCQYAVCGPSRASFLTGLRPDTTRCYNNGNLQVRENVPNLVTMPQHFKNNGYESLAIGKIFHHSSTQPGDDEQSWSRPAFHPGGPGYRHYFNKETLDYMADLRKKHQAKGKKGSPRGISFEAGEHSTDDQYPDGLVVARVTEALKELKESQKPFFLGVGFQKPHVPFVCPKKYWDLYPLESIELEETPLPEGANEFSVVDSKELRTYADIPKEGPFSPELQKNLIRGYKACVSFVDAQVGKVLDELEKNGLMENTVIVLIGDHGYHFGDHATWGKQTNFENATRAPLIVWTPKMKNKGQHTQALVEFVDIAPTITELAGLPQLKAFEGKSLVPLLENPGAPWKDAAYSQYERNTSVMGHTVRTKDYRLVQWYRRGNPPTLAAEELYDLKKDPTEMKSVAADPSYKKVKAQLLAKLQENWKNELPPWPALQK